jgi:hypothetical protein
MKAHKKRFVSCALVIALSAFTSACGGNSPAGIATDERLLRIELMLMSLDDRVRSQADFAQPPNEPLRDKDTATRLDNLELSLEEIYLSISDMKRELSDITRTATQAQQDAQMAQQVARNAESLAR